MATKANPGEYDCYAHAEQDEPLFVLLARDPSAEFLVAAWAAVRAGDLVAATHLMAQAIEALKTAGKRHLPYEAPKSIEAQQCAKNMRTWRMGKKMDEIESRCSKQS